MSSAPAISPFDPESENWWSKSTSMLAKQVLDASFFFQRLRIQMRFGEFTRAPLRLIRFQVRENVAECDCLARLPDSWDASLRPEIGHRHASIQALTDAVDVRSLLFRLLPDVDAAYLRIYRQVPVYARELVIAGHAHRVAPSFRSVHSIAMRAKLLGFRFSLENGVLASMAEMSNIELVDW